MEIKTMKTRKSKGRVVGKGIHLDGIRYAVLENDTIATNMICSCFSGNMCKNKLKDCKLYKVVAYEVKGK